MQNFGGKQKISQKMPWNERSNQIRRLQKQARTAKFLDDENVEGVQLLTDFELADEIRVRLLGFTNGSKTSRSPVMWPVSLYTGNIEELSLKPYVLAPKPIGLRFLLYVDCNGTVFLENIAQHVFRVDKNHTIEMASSDGGPITDTVLDGIFTRKKLNSEDKESKTEGELTFVVQDAIRCNGKDLTSFDILERIAFVNKEIMKPWLHALKDKTRSSEGKAFNIDIIEFKEAHQAEDYLSEGFENRSKYPLSYFHFYPRQMGYVRGTCRQAFRWAADDPQDCSFRLKVPNETKMSNEAEGWLGNLKYATVVFQTDNYDKIRDLDGKIISCRYVIDTIWIFQKVRNDRKQPNSKSTVEEKKRALGNPVTLHDILVCLDDWSEFSFLLRIPKEEDPKKGELYMRGPTRKEITLFDTIILTEEIRDLDGKIIGCRYIDHNWIFQKVRNDRNYPNRSQVVEDKIRALEDPAARQHLLTLLDTAKNNIELAVSVSELRLAE